MARPGTLSLVRRSPERAPASIALCRAGAAGSRCSRSYIHCHMLAKLLQLAIVELFLVMSRCEVLGSVSPGRVGRRSLAVVAFGITRQHPYFVTLISWFTRAHNTPGSRYTRPDRGGVGGRDGESGYSCDCVPTRRQEGRVRLRASLLRFSRVRVVQDNTHGVRVRVRVRVSRASPPPS